MYEEPKCKHCRKNRFIVRIRFVYVLGTNNRFDRLTRTNDLQVSACKYTVIVEQVKTTKKNQPLI